MQMECESPLIFARLFIYMSVCARGEHHTPLTRARGTRRHARAHIERTRTTAHPPLSPLCDCVSCERAACCVCVLSLASGWGALCHVCGGALPLESRGVKAPRGRGATKTTITAYDDTSTLL